MDSDESQDASSNNESETDKRSPSGSSENSQPLNHENDRAPSRNSSVSWRSNSSADAVVNNHQPPYSPINNADSRSSASKSMDSSDDEDEDDDLPSIHSREAHQQANLDDGNTSDSSESSKQADTQPEEISEGEMESDQEKPTEPPEPPEKPKENINTVNMSHEDLSDVSDLEDSIDHSDYGNSKDRDSQPDLDQQAKKIERSSRSEDGEEQLDFEAEDGECAESEVSKEKDDRDRGREHEAGEIDDDSFKKDKIEELEEGELTDEDDVRPEEVEPRPVCRFFSRGQCTWGASCRFLHPGVTDKGNYTMFDLVRPVIPGDYSERLMYSGGRGAEPPPLESAWERGLRTAKEMMRKSIKRKEQDIDFEEKKMNLSLPQEEFDKENGYYPKVASPEPRYVTVRHSTPVDYPPVRISHEEYYSRRQVIYEPEYPPAPRERVRTYREVQTHRPPPEYYNKHEEEQPVTTTIKTKRPKREVIVQRVEERAARGDEWSDPWMRSKSPAARKAGRKRSYSSGSSYSSSSSSHSSSVSSHSSYRSRSRSSHPKRSPRAHRRQVSPSVIVSERKAANERAALMNPPAPRKKALSPGMMRVGAQNPPAPAKVDQFGRTRSKLAVAAALARVKGRQRSSHSSSGTSSGTTTSDSDSSGSSSSSSRNGSPSPRRPSGVDLAMALKAKAIDALKSGSEKRQIKLTLKNSVSGKKPDFSEIARKAEGAQGRKRGATSPSASDPKGIGSKKASSRREELLKQLKAVEDAIAKKRSKVN